MDKLTAKMNSHRAKMNQLEELEIQAKLTGNQELAQTYGKKADYQFKQWLKAHKALHPSLYAEKK